DSTPKKGIHSNKNFVDAIEVTRKLGIRYIWIDSICIIQDQKEDWNVEAKLMHKVYRDSYCNLAAADSENCHGGLFRDRNSDVLPVRYSPKTSSRKFSGRNWRVLSSDLWDKVLLGSPLYTRGWVFQVLKRMLSPRLLQFGRNQMFWDCATVSACEALSAGLPQSLDSKAATDRYWRQRLQEADITVRSVIKTSEGSLEKLWERVVQTYTSCNLTKHTDKDVALWGIAKLMRDMLDQEYAHGLWTGRLEDQLAWQVVGPPKEVDPKRKNQEVRKEKEKNPFPYWSWAHLDVPIQVVPRFRGDPRFYVATNHQGGKVGFEFEEPFRWRLKRERFPMGQNPAGSITEKLRNVEKFGKASDEVVAMRLIHLVGNDWPADERSKLHSEDIAIQAHICKGSLRFLTGKERWVVVIEGFQRDAAIEAFPDTEPIVTQCEFLLLSASRVFVDDLGNETKYDTEENAAEDDIVKEDENGEGGYEDVKYSGVGILVERNGDRLKRTGAVTFRRICWKEFQCFRLACGDKALVDYGLDVRRGRKVWLI
ncbi:heterokaryon incompatibility protein-domain-containing protein, partial [Colletotrichum lupini]